MDSFLFQDLPEERRASQLEAISEGMEERDYAMFLTPEELVLRKSKFTTLAIQEAKLNDAKTEYLTSLKAEMKPIVTEKTQLLSEIKTGTVIENGVCYKVVDYETKMVGFYNKRGQMVEQRPMTMDDRQLVLKAATNF